MDAAESLVYNLAANRMSDSTVNINDLLEQNLNRIEQLQENNGVITGTPTGFIDLDDMTGGLQPGTLVVVGARPAVGKTSFALGMAAHAAIKAKLPVLTFSLEMSKIEISQRMLCAEARVDATRLRQRQANRTRLD